MNERVENIGARRLHTITERVLEDVSFNAPALSGETVTVDATFVDERLGGLLKDEDLSRYILLTLPAYICGLSVAARVRCYPVCQRVRRNQRPKSQSAKCLWTTFARDRYSVGMSHDDASTTATLEPYGQQPPPPYGQQPPWIWAATPMYGQQPPPWYGPPPGSQGYGHRPAAPTGRGQPVGAIEHRHRIRISPLDLGICFAIVAIIFFFIEKQNRFVKFHTAQAILLSIAYLVLFGLWFIAFFVVILGSAAVSAGSDVTTGNAIAGFGTILLVLCIGVVALVYLALWIWGMVRGVQRARGQVPADWRDCRALGGWPGCARSIRTRPRRPRTEALGARWNVAAYASPSALEAISPMPCL